MSLPRMAVVIGLVLLLVGPASAYRFESTESQITTDPSDQIDPSISGAVVAWTDLRNQGADIYMYDIEAGVETRVTNDPGDQYYNDISGNYIVYTDYGVGGGDVFLYDISTGQSRNLTNHPAEQRNPVISGNLVVFEDDRNGDYDIYAIDISTNQEIVVCDAPGIQRYPDVDGTIVVWEDYRNGSDYNIYLRDLSGGGEVQVSSGAANDKFPSVDGDIVVYNNDAGYPTNPGDILAYRISSGESFAITTGDAWERIPVVSGDYVAFERIDPVEGDADVWLYSLSLGEEVLATNDPADQYLQALDGNRLVYTDNRNGNLDIYLTDFIFDEPPPSGQGCDDPTAQVVFGPRVYTRGTGKPELEISAFAGLGLSGSGFLCISNGGDDGSLRVTSALVALNGERVAEPGDFGEDVESLQRPVQLCDANLLGVQLRGKPGSHFTLRIVETPGPEDGTIITCSTPPRGKPGLAQIALLLLGLAAWKRRRA